MFATLFMKNMTLENIAAACGGEIYDNIPAILCE